MDERSMFYGAKPEIFIKAKMLRSNETVAERKLWEKLSRNQLKGLRFKRQHPIDIYVVDFYCHKVRLVIEIDEAYHGNPKQKENDVFRTNDLVSFDLSVIRFTDAEIFNDMDRVLSKIENYILKLLP